MTTLVLVKHSLPEFIEELPASQWHLSVEGRMRAHRLVPDLTALNLYQLFSSQEPKAAETAEILASGLDITWQISEGLHEHVRPASTGFNQEIFESNVADFFNYPHQLIFGLETAEEAHARFSYAVQSILNATPSQNLGIVAHGTVISLFVSRWCDLEPFPLWKRLGLPSYVVLGLEPNQKTSLISINNLQHSEE